MPSRLLLLSLVLFVFQILPNSCAGDGIEDQRDVPPWFDENRVQAHFENGIGDDLNGLYQELHPAIRGMGARVLTRIFKTTAEGAWWTTEAGYTNELLRGRDLGREIAENAHEHGLKTFAYYRIMCDDYVEFEHPEWLCRDVAGELVLEPRTRKRPKEEDRKHVICFNSPARELVQTRLLELAERGVDGIYFDSWHMPEVCACGSCQKAFHEETGRAMPIKAKRGSQDYALMVGFTARSIVRNFRQWKQAVHAEYPDVMFAIGSSLYPCFETQMQLRAPLLEISDTSKTEFAKPFGGFLGWPEPNLRRRPYLEASFALPAYDVQNALGWSLTRDSCNGRPPLMWIPFTRTEREATFSAAAAISYGCVASIHPTGLWSRRTGAMNVEAAEKYRSVYALGRRVSQQLAGTRPSRLALLHISERSRDARIADRGRLWTEFFAPCLGVFEAFKESHLPLATVNDLQLRRGLPAETRLLILPCPNELPADQRQAVQRFEDGGGLVIRLEPGLGWHLQSDKPQLQQALLEQAAAVGIDAPLRVHGPSAMHAVFHRGTASGKTVVCLMNGFGWYRSEREPHPERLPPAAPPACEGVTIEISDSRAPPRRAYEAVTETELTIRRNSGRIEIAVPKFPVMACVTLE